MGGVYQRLNYLRFNQKQIRAKLYNGIQDAMISGDRTTNVGQQIILPSSFTGGPRQMHKLYQDAITIVRVFGKPDLFITITYNPKWPEIQNALLLEDIFEKVLAYLYTIEFQKRGLPYAHVLFILAQPYKPKTVADYDAIISAEISNKNSNSDTFNTVKQTMMHGLYFSAN
ncbi:hypothetical protein RhiirC2_797622 [Rhizophagus irregularis]|uniref:Helitron helicase-like domain-containing protein n=1 Tax=Rhizophagus irregularis TaxID=588596 RepID=A0A2N1M7S1_9GLOM|nr:hypothetical protein RhiirC2_797622 [Rhizophagus irregularis]